MAKPSRNRPTTTGRDADAGSRARRSRGRRRAATAIAATVRAAPNRATTRPASGSDSDRAGAIASSTRPSSPGSARSPSRTCGMRDAQLANAKPLRMKTAYDGVFARRAVMRAHLDPEHRVTAVRRGVGRQHVERLRSRRRRTDRSPQSLAGIAVATRRERRPSRASRRRSATSRNVTPLSVEPARADHAQRGSHGVHSRTRPRRQNRLRRAVQPAASTSTVMPSCVARSAERDIEAGGRARWARRSGRSARAKGARGRPAADRDELTVGEEPHETRRWRSPDRARERAAGPGTCALPGERRPRPRHARAPARPDGLELVQVPADRSRSRHRARRASVAETTRLSRSSRARIAALRSEPNRGSAVITR